MYKSLRGISGERTFRAATLSVLAIIVIFLLGVLAAMMAYTRWDAFITTLLSEEVLFAIRLSATTATLATIIAVAAAIPVAYAISKTSFPGKDIVDSLLDLPIVVSPVALGAALLVFFSAQPGAFINEHLVRFVFAVPGIVLAQVAVVGALAVRLLKSTFDSIDPRYEQVSRTLGCSKLQAFLKVTLPMARNGLIAAGILTWARAIGEFGATITLVGATALKTETLPIAISLNLASANIEKAIAVVFILIIIAVIVLFVLRKLVGKRFPAI